MISAGTVIANYTVLKRISQGVNFILYQGESVAKAPVSIKVPVPLFAKNYEFLKQMERTFQKAKRLDHPCITQAYFCSPLESSIHALISEHLPGINLRTFLGQHGKIFPEIAIMLALKICEALKHIQANEMIFGGLKPENIILSPEKGIFKMTDVGISTVPDDLIDHVSQMQSLAYLSPEQVRLEARDHRTDLYALGILLYHMTTGKEPFLEKDPLKSLRLISANTPVPPPKADAVKMTEEVSQIISKLCQSKQEARYNSIEALEKDLRKTLEIVQIKDLDEEIRAFLTAPQPYSTYFVKRMADAYFERGKSLYLSRERKASTLFFDRAKELDGKENQRVTLFYETSERKRKIFTIAVSITIIVLFVALGVLYHLIQRIEKTHVPPPNVIATQPQPEETVPVLPQSTLETGDFVLIVDQEVDVFIDEKPFGKTLSQSSFSLIAGQHSIRLENPDFLTHTETFTIEPNKRLELSVQMKPKPAYLSIEGDAEGFTIYINDRLIGTTPISEPIEVLPGKHVIEVKKGNRTVHRVEHDFAPDSKKSLKIR